MKKLTIVAAVMAVMLTAGCRRSQNVETASADNAPAWYEDDSTLWNDLYAAVADVQKFDSSNIVTDLTPIKKGYPGQEWGSFDGKDMVLVVTLVDSSRMQRFFGRDDVYQIDREMGTWISLPAEWVERKAVFEGLDSVAAHTRLLQLFGLSPDCDYDIMVQFYADPASMFRPAHDPDITTTTVGLEFPANVDENYKVGATNFREWYRYSLSAAYEDDSPLPWTQLGYTYDWHQGGSHRGLSEYVVGHQALIKVKSCETVWQFVKNL